MRGMFGEVTIKEQGGVRSLLIGNQTQGSLFLEPDASEIDKDLSGPIIPASAYTYGWLVGATQNPSASVLQIGLGSGAGILGLLSNFDELDVTVVEIDEVIVSVALKAFPALEGYLNKGRLNIVIEDAKTYLANNPQVFDFACADAYTGRGNKHVVSYHALLRHRCKEVYFNIIDSVEHKLIKATQETFKDLGMPLKWGMRAIPPELLDSPYIHSANWIVTTADVDWNLVDAFEPFKGLDGPQVDWARVCWNSVINSPFEL
jgi:hypothetical protein